LESGVITTAGGNLLWRWRRRRPLRPREAPRGSPGAIRSSGTAGPQSRGRCSRRAGTRRRRGRFRIARRAGPGAASSHGPRRRALHAATRGDALAARVTHHHRGDGVVLAGQPNTEVPVRFASAAGNTILARWTSPADAVDARVTAISRSRSPARNSNAEATYMTQFSQPTKRKSIDDTQH
jgi:hypothetical protein